MKLSELKDTLKKLETINICKSNNEIIPKHFHLTEIAKLTKDYIDCGGTLRHEEKISFQLWVADDYNHRLTPSKLLGIISKAEKTFLLANSEIEIEYQGDTIEIFNINFDGSNFVLENKFTDCLAKDKCGIDNIELLELTKV
ncbi:DUF6428 family protein [Candidatus Kapabacteria bacterium]|nr:DUF6428 family protein [Candidatus Kapabacteria bacterium]